MPQPNPGDPLAPIPLTPAHGSVPHSVANMYGPNPFAVASPTAAPTGGHRSLPTLAELFHSFKRRWLLGLLIGGIVASVVAAAIWMVMPSGKHQVRAIIKMQATVSNGLFKEAGQDNDAFERYKDSQKANMQTRTFLSRVGNDPSVRNLPMMQGDKAGVYENLLVFKWDSPELLHVKMNGDDQEQLRLLLSAFVKVYAEEAKSEERASYVSQEIQLKGSLANANAKIEAIEAKIREKRTIKGGVGGSDAMFQRQQYILSINNLAPEIDKLYRDEILLLSEVQQVEKELGGELQIDEDLLAQVIDSDSAVRGRLLAVEKAKDELRTLNKSLQPGNPVLAEKEIELGKLKSFADAERNAIRPQIIKVAQAERRVELNRSKKQKVNSIETVRAQLTTLKAKKSQAEKDLRDLGEVELEKQISSTELTPTIDIRNRYSNRLDEIQGILKNDNPRVTIQEDAVIAENYNLKQKMVMATGGACVAMLGILLIISYIEWRNRRVDGVDQVVTELGMRVIGTIPAFPSRASLRNGEASQNQNWRFILNESVNSTRTMLLHTAKTQQMQIILVTSAMQGEGKTSLSSQLATSMATAGLRTLILDCDLRNPSMQKLFDIPVAPGCSEILLQEIDIADAVQPTSVPNLWIIPAGQCNHRVIAALAQGHPLEAMFNRLRGQFDIIVVDSCPILPVADTLLVAQHVDGVVFSILQDVSQLPKVQDASDRMVHLNIPLLGAVVNGIKPDIQAYGYNYVKQLPA